MDCRFKASECVAAMTVAFSERMNRLHRNQFFMTNKHYLLGIDACFECHNNGAFSKILQVTNRQTDKDFDYCNTLRMR